MDSSLIDMEKAAARMTTAGGPGVSVQTGTGIKVMVGVMVLLGMGAAFGVGYAVQGTRYSREIESKQKADSADIKKFIETAQAVSGEPIHGLVEEHAALIEQAAKKVADAQTSGQVTDATIKALAIELEGLHKACIAYVEKGPIMDPDNVIRRSVFDGEAVRALYAYDGAIKKLYYASVAMAEEDVIFNEYKAQYDPSSINPESVMRAWRWATVTDAKSRPKGYLVGITLPTDKDGNYLYEDVPVVVPEGFKLPAGQRTHTWKIKVKYDNPKLIGGKTEDLVETDLVVQWDIKDDVKALAIEETKKFHEGYRFALLRRMMDRVSQLSDAARPAVLARASQLKKIAAQ